MKTLELLVALGYLVCTSISCGVSAGTGNSSCTLTSYSSFTAGKAVGIALSTVSSNVGLALAQPFIITTAGKAIKATAALQLKGTFVPGSNALTATLQSDQAATGVTSPSSTVLGTSATVDPSTISNTAASYVPFTFAAPVSLAVSTAYWLVITASYAVNSTNYVSWQAFNGLTGGYSVGGTLLPMLYETNTPDVYSNAGVGSAQFLDFNIGC